jgi:hypothetical protein
VCRFTFNGCAPYPHNDDGGYRHEFTLLDDGTVLA